MLSGHLVLALLHPVAQVHRVNEALFVRDKEHAGHHTFGDNLEGA